MPCRIDHYYNDCADEEAKIESLKKHIDELTRMLCSSCKVLEKRKVAIPTNTVKWWENHKKVDAAREKKEKKKRKKREKS